MRLHILGVCGTFMGSLAQLAKSLGHDVSGSDAGVYPPMSDQLLAAGIVLYEGFLPEHIPADVDCVIIGNALSRGNPAVEFVLERGLPYTSGPQWLSQHVLQGRWVLAVAGTHGKTTTASMLAWILDVAGMAPGYLIGGVPENFGVSARLGHSPFFVIEADEYDTAFFDKRSKFVHYQARTLVMNNLEYDHADIFPDLASIERQFHHLVRTVPSNGQLILSEDQAALDRVLAMGQWTPVERFALMSDDACAEWQWRLDSPDASTFSVWHKGLQVASVAWILSGLHNVHNAVAAMIAARHVGVKPDIAAQALSQFDSVKRRMERIGEVGGVTVFDDFAHHPTAIRTTLAGARARHATSGRLIAVLEPRSNTMKLGVHQQALAESVADADAVFWFQPAHLDWSVANLVDQGQSETFMNHDMDAFIAQIAAYAQPDDTVVVMSNGGFANTPRRLLQALQARFH